MPNSRTVGFLFYWEMEIILTQKYLNVLANVAGMAVHMRLYKPSTRLQVSNKGGLLLEKLFLLTCLLSKLLLARHPSSNENRVDRISRSTRGVFGTITFHT